jgi:hypothetical protein
MGGEVGLSRERKNPSIIDKHGRTGHQTKPLSGSTDHRCGWVGGWVFNILSTNNGTFIIFKTYYIIVAKEIRLVIRQRIDIRAGSNLF